MHLRNEGPEKVDPNAVYWRVRMAFQKGWEDETHRYFMKKEWAEDAREEWLGWDGLQVKEVEMVQGADVPDNASWGQEAP